MFGNLTVNPSPYLLQGSTLYELYNTTGGIISLGTISISGGSTFLILDTTNNVIGNETTEFQQKVNDGTVDPFLESGDLIFRINSVDQTKFDFYQFYNEYIPAYERATLVEDIYVKESQTELQRVKQNSLDFDRETLIFQYSVTDQFPNTTDTVYHFTYDNVSDIITPQVTLGSNGQLTINESGQYYVRIFGHFGRTTSSGTAKCLFFGEFDFGGGFAPVGVSKVFMVSNTNDFESFEFETFFTLPAGVKLRYCMVRDSSGNDSGGVYSFSPNYVGAPDFPSIGVDISRIAPN